MIDKAGNSLNQHDLSYRSIATILDSLDALVYVAEDNTEGAPRAGYMERIVAAAESQGLPEAYVEKLRTWLHVK